MLIEFSPYLPPEKCPKIVKKILLLSLILKPEQTKKLVEKLAKYWGDQQGRLGQLTFTKAIWFFLRKGDQLLEKARRESSKSGKTTDLYGLQKRAFDELKREVTGFGEDFANLILCLWVTKQTLGKRSFCKGKFSFWRELLGSYPEIKNLFRGPGISLSPKRTEKISRVQPKSKRRRKPVKEKEAVRA